ncbi:MAG: serine/threonine protein kinase, partial [Eggerthellaceae bacterium]|nr:serine/threonine protein kinase [Eggerthellaceae bacterium]
MSEIISQVWPEWHVEEMLGQGSYGKVYRAVRSSHGHSSYAAIKVINIPQNPAEAEDLALSGMDESSVRSYFEQRARDVLEEVALMEELKGAPNVMSIEDYQLVEQSGNVGWTVLVRMPLLESAKDRLARMGQPDTREVARLGVDVCKALSSCHAKGVIHRDVKPENIFFGEYGYQLGDFGIARRLGPDAGSAHTRAGAYPYMAPEVFAGRGYGANVDTYSLGLVLYRYLNGGRMPFLPAEGVFTPADSERAVALRLAGRALPAPKNADATLASIVLRATNPDPTRRFESAAEMGAALQAWAFGGRAAATTPTENAT